MPPLPQPNKYRESDNSTPKRLSGRFLFHADTARFVRAISDSLERSEERAPPMTHQANHSCKTE
jgi:hypothetical protein